ncbi:MAG: MmcQ-like protein [Bacteroidetes bacterium]|nr:MAG: MmcQ-like protein [Bacteroidota bacterium]
MNIEELREYALSKPGASESFPFGENTLVFKVKDKIFLLAGLDEHPLQFNVKCDPDKAIELREQYAAVKPGYHMNKKHWNTVVVDGSVDNRMIKSFIDHSFELVAGKKRT